MSSCGRFATCQRVTCSTVPMILAVVPNQISWSVGCFFTGLANGVSLLMLDSYRYTSRLLSCSIKCVISLYIYYIHLLHLELDPLFVPSALPFHRSVRKGDQSADRHPGRCCPYCEHRRPRYGGGPFFSTIPSAGHGLTWTSRLFASRTTNTWGKI